jgi:hypothetical protein
VAHAGVERQTAKVTNGRISVGGKVCFLEDYAHCPTHTFKAGDVCDVLQIWQDGSIVTIKVNLPNGGTWDVWTCYAKLAKV